MRFLTIREILISVDLNQAVKQIFKLRDCVQISDQSRVDNSQSGGQKPFFRSIKGE